jgi:acetyl-CoA C-acetyltransferase
VAFLRSYFSGVLTAIADSLKGVPPTELAGKMVAKAVKRSGADSAEVGYCVIGNVTHSDRQDM